MPSILVDIDGTIADGTHRKHLITSTNPDWKAFLEPELVFQDRLVHENIPRIFNLLQRNYHLIFLTARNEGLKDVTERWLHQKVFEFKKPRSVELIMRAKGDTRVSSEYKTSQIANKGGIIFAFDDCKWMLTRYLSFGIVPIKAPECWEINNFHPFKHKEPLFKY